MCQDRLDEVKQCCRLLKWLIPVSGQQLYYRLLQQLVSSLLCCLYLKDNLILRRHTPLVAHFLYYLCCHTIIESAEEEEEKKQECAWRAVVCMLFQFIWSSFCPHASQKPRLNSSSSHILKPFSNPLAASRASTCRWKETRWATSCVPSLPNTRRSRQWRSPSPTSSRGQSTRPGRGTSSPAEWWSGIRDDGKRQGGEVFLGRGWGFSMRGV